MAALAAAALGGSALGGAFNLGNTALAGKTNLDLQNNQQDFQKWQIANREKAFTEQGLPRFMAYSGGPSMPNTYTYAGGNNYLRTGMGFSNFNVGNGMMPQIANMYNAGTVNSNRARSFNTGTQTSPWVNTRDAGVSTNPLVNNTTMASNAGTQTALQDVPPSPQQQALQTLLDFKYSQGMFK